METISDIVREIRFAANQPNCVDRKEALALAERIEKAYKFMVEGLNGGIVERDKYIEKLTNENARLKAALRPVIECDRYSCDCGAEYAVKCSSAVNDAHRIWKEGEK